jgi:hypothetical protein
VHLLAGVRWIRLIDDVWVPADEVEGSVIGWMVYTLQNKKYPGWERILDLLQERVTFLSELQDNPRSKLTRRCSKYKTRSDTIMPQSTSGVEAESSGSCFVFHSAMGYAHLPLHASLYTEQVKVKVFDIPRLLGIVDRYRKCDNPSENENNTQEVLLLGIFLHLWEYEIVLALGKRFQHLFMSPQHL